MNVVGITGNLTADPELKTTPSGDSVCAFTVAVRRPHTKDKTDFIDCVAWRERAEFVTRYFGKGKKIEVSGYLTSRIYGNEDARKKVTELVCEDVSFGGKKEEESIDIPKQENVISGEFQEISIDDDLPF